MVSVMGFSDLSEFDARRRPRCDPSAAGEAFSDRGKRPGGAEDIRSDSTFFSHHIGYHHGAPANSPISSCLTACVIMNLTSA